MNADVAFGLHGGRLVFNGTWNSRRDPDYAGLQLSDGATLVLGAAAHINNNRSDLINARPFTVWGDGNGEGGTPHNVLDCDPGFDCDRMGYDPVDRTNWTNDGLSTLRIGNLHWITRCDANLPSVNKKAGGTYAGTHTDHGVITFDLEPGALWEVRDSAQRYEGVIDWKYDWTLDCQADLRSIALYHDEAHVYVGPLNSNTTVVKRGPGTWRLDGTQGWYDGAILRVAAGAVVFNTDTDPWLTGWPEASADRRGRRLRLEVGAGARAAFVRERSALVMPRTDDRPQPVDLDLIGLDRAELLTLALTADAARAEVSAGKTVACDNLLIGAAPATAAAVLVNEGLVQVDGAASTFRISGSLRLDGAGLTRIGINSTPVPCI